MEDGGIEAIREEVQALKNAINYILVTGRLDMLDKIIHDLLVVEVKLYEEGEYEHHVEELVEVKRAIIVLLAGRRGEKRERQRRPLWRLSSRGPRR